MLRNLLLALSATGILQAGINLRLPTENHHLFTGEPERFYMHVDRTFEGEASKPWEGGAFGLVRNAMRINGEVLLTKFHEGIDIAPIHRDRAGNPLDLVSSIADGRVVHVSPISGRSNYGKYVVVEHAWENSLIYSLYAHLAEITCNPGDAVKAGSALGRMGYTGAGLYRTRAHVHLELAMLMSRRFDDWQKAFGGGINHHGLFNGMNLTGSDVARFFIEQRANPELQFSALVASTPVYFKVTVPSRGTPDFVIRHPWMRRGDSENSVSWEISFSATGQPVAFTHSQRQVDGPTITAIRPSQIPHRYLTRNLVSGQENRASLTQSGKQLVALLTDDFPILREQAMDRKKTNPEG
ncbi:MAG: M23 family metallopeptidase [Luteolibacter sp.]|jgi:murein DD-endopeptidase MepM/ murein hydrolase activator NlpD|nr:M23 family metallopeptidase [Luteolibacter sp.]